MDQRSYLLCSDLIDSWCGCNCGIKDARPMKLLRIMFQWKQVVSAIACLCCCTLGQIAREDAINEDNYARLQAWIDQVCMKYVDPSGLIAVIPEDVETLYYHHFRIHFQGPVMLNEYRTDLISFPWYQKPDMYIIFLVADNAEQILDSLRGMNTWHPQAKVIICYQKWGDQTKYIKALFEVLYQYYIFNVVIATLDLNIYTYDPYILGNFNEPNLGIVQLGSQPSEEVFFNKIPRDWNNSRARVTPVNAKPYVISVEDKSGLDIDILETIANKLGLILDYDMNVHLFWGLKAPNGTYSSVYGMIQRDETDFAVGYFHLRDPDNLVDFDYTFTYIHDPLIWAAPCPLPIDNWFGLILIFAKDTWMGILIVLALSVVAWQLIGRLVEKGYFATWYSLEVPFQLFLSLSISTDPKRTATRLMYLTSWFFGFILTTSWLSSLMASLTHIKYEKPVHDIQEAIERGLTFGVHFDLLIMYDFDDDPVSQFIINNHVDCNLGGGCWERTSYKRDMATMLAARILRYATYDRFMNDKGESLMVIMEGSAINLDHSLLYFSKGHPMYEQTSQLLMRICEGGFIDYFEFFVNYRHAITKRRNIFDPNHLETKKFSIKQLFAPFAFLVVGLLLGGVSFFFELLKDYMQSPQNRIY